MKHSFGKLRNRRTFRTELAMDENKYFWAKNHFEKKLFFFSKKIAKIFF